MGTTYRVIFAVDVSYDGKGGSSEDVRTFTFDGKSFELSGNGDYTESWKVGCIVFDDVSSLLEAMGLSAVDSSEVEMDFENIKFGHTRYRDFKYVPLSTVDNEEVKEIVQLLRAELPPLALYSNAIEIQEDGSFAFDEEFPMQLRYYVDVVVSDGKLKQVEVIPEFYFSKTRSKTSRSVSTFFQPL